MKKIYSKRIKNLFFLAVLLVLTACSAYDSGANKQAADKAVEQSKEIPAQAVQIEDTDKNNVQNFTPDKKELPKPFSENPYGMELYKAVLQEGATFYSTDAKEDITINQLTEAVSPAVYRTIPTEFAVIDLDGDGQLEVILRLTVNENPYAGYEILRCQDEMVYGYTIWYRAFMELATDGTFRGSGGAGWQSWNTIQFDADTYSITEYAHTEIYFDSQGSKALFFVGEENVSESVYYSKVSEWRNGDPVRWYAFTDENLNQIFTE